MQKDHCKNVNRKIFELMKPRFLQYIIGILGMDLSGTATIILVAFSLKFMVDMQINQQYFLGARIGILFLILIGSFLCIPITYFMYQSAIKKTMFSIKSMFMNRIQRLKLEDFEKQSSGDFIVRATEDMKLFERVYGEMIQTISGTLILGVGSIVFMLILEWRVSLILIAVSIFSVSVNKILTSKMKSIQDMIVIKKDKLANRVLELLQGFYTIKVYHFDKVNKDGQNLISDIHKNSIKNVRYGAVLEGVNYMAGLVNFVGAMCVSSFLIIRNVTDMGTVIALIILQMNISETFLKLGNAAAELKVCLAGAGRVLQVMELPIEKEAHDFALKSLNTISEIKLKNLSFSYGENEVLSSINLTAREGDFIVITGASGCGKSTILKLLNRYYSVQPSMIKLQGISIEQYALDTVRSRIAYVPQNNYLFHGTVRENITCAIPGAKEDDIILAAKKAYAHSFIMELPEAYDTVIEEKGSNLSAGQGQRIALARAFYKKAPVLILDEATAFLDYESEQYIIGTLKELAKKSIVILVSHRVSTIERADLIYMIDNGKVAARGNHEDLMKNNRFYSDYFKSLIKEKKGAACCIIQ